MRRIWSRLVPVAVLLAASAASPAGAQEVPSVYTDSTMVDRVLAVVGDSVILASQVAEQVNVARSQGQPIGPREVLDELINTQLVLQAAAMDSTMVVDPQDLDQRVEEAMQGIRGRFPSQEAFQQALQASGMTLAGYRDQLREQIRAGQIRQMFLQRQLQNAPPVSVTETEMREFYDAQRQTLQERPELLSLEQVMIQPGASDSSWTQARARADSLFVEITQGADFAELARENSEDTGSAQQGGDLGWFRRGVMVREFEQVAFRLADGQVSAPVRTPYGFHIIKVERSRPGEVKARHILVRPVLSPEDESRARVRADEVVERARAGEPMDSLYAEYGDEDQTLEFTISREQLGQFPYPGYSEALSNAAEGDVVGPFRTQVGNTSYLAVVRVAEVREAGEFTFEDLRDQIRSRLLQQKRIERIYQQLRDRTFIDIRM